MRGYTQHSTSTDNSYSKLCKYSDEILLKNPRSKIRVAIPVLHIVRDHPVFLKNYFQSGISSNLIKLIRNLAGIVRSLALSALIGKSLSRLHVSSEKVRVIFISHRILKDDLYNELDFYFSDLSKNYKSKSVLIDHTREGFIKTQNLIMHQKGNKLLLPKILNFKVELFIHWEMIKESITLFIESFQYLGFKRDLALHAAIDCLSQETAFAIRLGRYISQIVKKYNPSLLIMTYEGHAWERIAFYEAHAENENLRCVGYQHAAVFKNQYSIQRSLGPNFDPDYIVTSGNTSARLLKQSLELSEKVIGVLGSNRALGKISLEQTSACLVIPEGIIEECILLLKFTIECALLNPNIKFIYRLHPVILPEKYHKLRKLLSASPLNLIFSINSLRKDIERSKFVLFRGSTAVVPAVGNGVIPIYYKAHMQANINPLFEMENHIHMVMTPHEFTSIVKNQQLVNSKLQVYCKDFYSPIDRTIIDLILKDNAA